MIETIVAFSNTKGGKIYVGVNDRKEIVGIQLADESIQNWINEVKQSTQPAVFPDFNVIKTANKTIVEIVVDEFPLKPISYKNRYFSRKQNSNHLLSIDEITEMRFISLNYSFDSFTVETSFEELDAKALAFFEKRINESGRFLSSGSLKDDFAKLGLIINGKLTRAAQLLFGTHFTGIHIGRFKARDVIIDDMVIRSPLVLAVEEAMNFIKRNIRLGYEFTGEIQRKEVWQFPLPAIRELLLNAVVHKDYSNPTDVIIKIFDDSIEISNPGRLLNGLSIEDLQTDHYQAKHRNKLLTEMFYLMGDIEKYGTGYVRLRNWLKEYPEIQYNVIDLGDFFRIEFIEKTTTAQVTEQVTEQVAEQVTEQVKRLLTIFQNKRTLLSISDVMSLLLLKHRPSFLYTYLQPALKQDFVAMEFPNSPNHPKQRYFLTEKGKKAIK